jgi:hypothetical protein
MISSSMTLPTPPIRVIRDRAFRVSRFAQMQSSAEASIVPGDPS